MSLKIYFILLRLFEVIDFNVQYLTMKRTVVKFRKHEIQTSRFYLCSGSHKSDGVVLNGFFLAIFCQEYIAVASRHKYNIVIQINLLKYVNTIFTTDSHITINIEINIQEIKHVH